MATIDTVRGIAKMPIGFRADEATTESFPTVNPPSLRQSKMDDRGQGVASNQLVDHAAALAAGDAMLNIPRPRTHTEGATPFRVEGEAEQILRDYDAAVILAKTHQFLTERAGQHVQRITALLGGDDLDDSYKAELRQILRAVVAADVDQELADRTLAIASDRGRTLSQKIHAVGTLVRTRFPEPCPAFCDGDHDGEDPADDIRPHVQLIGEVSSGPVPDYDRSVIRVTVERTDTFGVPGVPVVRLDLVGGDWVLCSPRAVFRLGRLLVKARQVLRQVQKAGA